MSSHPARPAAAPFSSTTPSTEVNMNATTTAARPVSNVVITVTTGHNVSEVEALAVIAQLARIERGEGIELISESAALTSDEKVVASAQISLMGWVADHLNVLTSGAELRFRVDTMNEYDVTLTAQVDDESIVEIDPHDLGFEAYELVVADEAA